MPDTTIDFTISIPIRTINADDVRSAFASKFGYQATLQDAQGNIFANPVTPEMFVEDCVANYLLKVTADYLVDQSIRAAIDTATASSQDYINDIKDYFSTQ